MFDVSDDTANGVLVGKNIIKVLAQTWCNKPTVQLPDIICPFY